MYSTRVGIVAAAMFGMLGFGAAGALAQDVQLELEVDEDGNLMITGGDAADPHGATGDSGGADDTGGSDGDGDHDAVLPTRVDAGSAGLAVGGLPVGLVAFMAAGATAISVPALVAARRS